MYEGDSLEVSSEEDFTVEQPISNGRFATVVLAASLFLTAIVFGPAYGIRSAAEHSKQGPVFKAIA